ncbi:NUDIX hydrolase [Phreatobacter stygius]|uniref:NrtR DNA-binding winged helix domain-containing protein n=1 Tax=Phreatobacter stygius TaxID=1940610 RepID=A0A4D7B1J9_9HYPH|nr:hypothetical protein [Phreatobacter stygius]QCI67589.1 hypothetical protein E8M01_27200 [Phreatobacter stygius]
MPGPAKRSPSAAAGGSVAADLIAVLVAVTGAEPRVMTIREASALPSGPFELSHRSLQSGLRAWVEQQTAHPLGYVEQLYTFADRDRTGDDPEQRVISISYLGLTREEQAAGAAEAGWRSWYDYFPWEDLRGGPPPLFDAVLAPRLKAWAEAAGEPGASRERWQRAAITFGFDGRGWNEELVLQRYELLFEAGLVPEAGRDRPAAKISSGKISSGKISSAKISSGKISPSKIQPLPGRAMLQDHRRILATGIARLRAKIKYRPVVFELMPPTFTLLQLQRSVEALAGHLLHKQNFRRLIEQQDLVEETGAISADTGGRPAKLFRFRHAVRAERAVAGTKLPLSRP